MNLTDTQSPWKDIIEDFFLTCKVEGNSKNTMEWYRFSIIPLINSLKEISGLKKEDISPMRTRFLSPDKVQD